jgi:hypothetical protein
MSRCGRPDWGADAHRLKAQVLKWSRGGYKRFKGNLWGRLRWQQHRHQRSLTTRLSRLRASSSNGWGPYRQKMFDRYCKTITHTLQMRREIRDALSGGEKDRG